MRAPSQHMSGLRKAAIVVAMLDTDNAVQVCSHLDADSVRQIAEEIARISALSQNERDAILADFVNSLENQFIVDGRDKARELIKNVLGLDPEKHILSDAERAAGLDHLHDLDPATLYRYLQSELPQTLAVILSLLPSQRTAAFLEMSDEQLRAEIIVRMATLRPLAPGALQALNEGLTDLTSSLITTEARADRVSPQLLADIISNLPMETAKSTMAILEERIPDVAAVVGELIFTFEDVLKLDDRSLQIVLRATDERTLALAMKNLPDESKARIFSNVSSRAREMLQQEIELLGPVPVSQVEAAQKKIAATARELGEKGEITIRHNEQLI